MYVQCLIFHFKIIIKIKWWKEWCAFFVRSHSSTFQDIFFFCYLFGCWNLKSELKSLTCIDRHTQIKSMFSYCTYSICLWQKDISYRLQAKYTHTVHCANMYVHIHTLWLSENTGKIFTKFIETLSNSLLWLRFLCVFIYIDSSTHHRAHKRGKSSRHN